jgi:maleate isomerase
VQAEYDAMRPPRVTNHFGHIHIPNDLIRNDDDFDRLMVNVRTAVLQAIDRVMTCEPDYLRHVVGDLLGRPRRQRAPARKG